MILKSFRIFNYRSINDSGTIDASRITAILGRNESGKSNVLRALESLNSADGFKALNPIKDFPRHRKLTECTDDTKVIESVWELDDGEQQELAEIWPRANGVKTVEVARQYSGEARTVSIRLDALVYDSADVKATSRKIVAAVKAKAAELEDGLKVGLDAATETFGTQIASTSHMLNWAKMAAGTLAALRQALATANVKLPDAQDQHITDLEGLAETITEDEDAHTKARAWVMEHLPKFIYLDDYPEISGHQDIAGLLDRRANDRITQADINFEKMCKVAGLKPDELHALSQSGDHETRSQLANRAGAVITTAIRRLWKDRLLKVRFNLDAQHFDTLISDPNSVYDVEVNLNERSRGFQWFFAFYIIFAADTDGGDAADAILLLDEPGLYLHAKSQGDLLKHLEVDFINQILYTTHSPFMVPTQRLDEVRTVNIAEDIGTTITNDPTGDARTLFPLQAALGYDLAQSLFVGPNNLVVEGVTDFWILSSVSEFLADIGKTALSSNLTITPAGGAQKVHYMVALLTSEALNVLVLLDDEKDAKATKNDLVKSKLIRDQNVLFVSEAFPNPASKEVDIEDLLNPAVYEALVCESYAKELKGKKLVLNDQLPRIARRVEAAFEGLGIAFHKTRPTRLFLKKMASDPASVMDADAIARFERLLGEVNARFKKHVAREDKPFS